MYQQKNAVMKTINLNKIATVIFFAFSIGSACAQNVSGKIWATIENEQVLPYKSDEGELVSTDQLFNNLIKSLGIVEIKRAFPSSRNSKLLKVYEISSTSSKEDLYANAVNNVNQLSKV